LPGRSCSAKLGNYAGYLKINQIGRGCILGAAMAGTGSGLWLYDRLMLALKALKGGQSASNRKNKPFQQSVS
tara:strand:- start:90 stop:305 length:216 start_codon:yes stop_codon:yes gene_type:complete